MANDEIKINPKLLETAREVFVTISEQRPEHSFSFVLTEEGYHALEDAIKVVEWGIGGNKPKLKETALEQLAEFMNIAQGNPVNINMTEYELKSMGEVVEAIDKALDSHEDGVLS